MSFVDSLVQELLTALVPRITEAVIRDLTSQMKQNELFRFDEEEAAEKLGISTKALAQLRKDGEIEYTYSLLPKMGEDKKLHGGRVSYTPKHINDYLQRNEQKRFFGNLRTA